MFEQDISGHRRWCKHVARKPDPCTHGHKSQCEQQHDQGRQKSGAEELQGRRVLAILLGHAPRG